MLVAGNGRVRMMVVHLRVFVRKSLVRHDVGREAVDRILGFGLPPEQPAIGVILSESMAYLSAGMWWLAVFPGLALIATVLLFDLAGSSLRKLVDPHSAQE